MKIIKNKLRVSKTEIGNLSSVSKVIGGLNEKTLLLMVGTLCNDGETTQDKAGIELMGKMIQAQLEELPT